MSIFSAVIGHGTAIRITWWQMSIRAVIVFIVGIAMVRGVGKRAFGQQSAIDIVLAVLIGSNLSRAMTGGSPFGATLAATIVLLGLYWLCIHAAQSSDTVGALLKGEHTVVLRDGTPDAAAMRKVGMSHLDLDEALRAEGIESLDDARLATMERSGHVSVVRRKE